MKRCRYSFLGFFLLFFAAIAQAIPKGQTCAGLLAAPALHRASGRALEQGWRETGLNFTHLNGFLTNERCYQSELEFMKCVAALRELATFIEENATALPLQREALAPYVEKTIARGHALEIVRLKKIPAKDAASAFSLSRDLARLIDDSWRALLRADARVDFVAEKGKILSLLPQTGQEALITAAAINRWLVTEDAHARLVPEKVIQAERVSDVAHELVGIGVVLAGQAEQLRIDEVMPDSPAEAEGLQVGDVITSVDGKGLNNEKFSNVVSQLQGVTGSTVRIGIQRGGQSLEFTLTRKAVSVKNVHSKLYTRGETKLGYIKLSTFMSEAAPRQMYEAIQTLTREGAQGLILDLRNNPGGDLNVTVQIAGLFLGSGKNVVLSRSLYPKQIQHTLYRTGAGPEPTKLPLIVLINARSASASELLSGALQDYGRALVVGDRSFGKGTVQRSLKPTDGLDGLPLLLFRTIARFHLPSGRTNQVVGITPDFLVYHSPNPKPSELVSFREGDIYPNALPAEGPSYQPRSPQWIAWLNRCVETHGMAKRNFHEHKSEGIPLDYQLLFSADLFDCLKRAVTQMGSTPST